MSVAMIGSPASQCPLSFESLISDDRHARQAGSAAAPVPSLRVIAVGVQPDRVADAAGGARRRLVAEVGVEEHVAGRQHDGRRGLVIECAVRGRRSGCSHPCLRHAHLVDARRQAVEDVVAVGVRRSSYRCGIERVDRAVAVGVVPQLHRRRRQADLVRILPPVTVGVDPHPVADGSRGRCCPACWSRSGCSSCNRSRRSCAPRPAANATWSTVRRARAVLVVGRVGRQRPASWLSGSTVTV